MAPAKEPSASYRGGETPTREPLVTRRRWREIRHRATAFAPATSTVGELLAQVGPEVRVVFMVGKRPGAGTAQGFRSWAFGKLPEGWSRAERQHLESSSTPILEYVDPDGRHVQVSRAAAWFGEGDYLASHAAAAHDQTRALIEARFPGATLLLTPATTGRELFVHEIPRTHEFPVLSDELQELIRDTAGQHRYDPTDDELSARAGDELAGLFEYDARFQYAALAWGLAVGVPTRATGDAFDEHARARYRVTARVPDTWSHLGILGVKAGVDRWRYPRDPGAQFDTWADGCEVALARRHGWEIEIHERIVWAQGKPLDKWAAKLVAARESVTDTDRVSGLVRAALRLLLITSIGAMHGTPRLETFARPLDEPRPRGERVRNLRAEGDVWVWGEPSSGGWATLRHPEWSAAIWARSRCRALSSPTGTPNVRAGAFTMPPEAVVAIRADAVYLDRRAEWPDDGRTGRFRLVRERPGPLRRPTSHVDLLALREGHA